ncbi:hypothetical protein SJ05684_b47410 (plasmid) [Sinorhizobium sojae CCBAU 05684]|uniref:Uncharacterized protein n=1 Tax=Sinorhizobium sojae CCBAU 05684 TaxID=716928 RepID=A0A249PIG1_9HYPH|nr:hypothetical protein SJ05684_b47410 [Sinorhizobium sojae CCBAU 05684]
MLKFYLTVGRSTIKIQEILREARHQPMAPGPTAAHFT